MSESLTGAEAGKTDGLPTQPTEGQQQQTPAESQNQETNSQAQATESVSDDTAQQNQNQNGDGKQTQTEQKGSESQSDDGLVKFAKSQGVEDVSKLSDNELRFLKMAHDNQKAFRERGKGLVSAANSIGGDNIEARLARLEYEQRAESFFEGKDRSLEKHMVEVLNEKRGQYGDEYAASLTQDLDALYGLAQVRAGQVSSADVEAIRREERESIRRQQMAGAPQAHAVSSGNSSSSGIDSDWIKNEYNPNNPEHTVALDAYLRAQQ